MVYASLQGYSSGSSVPSMIVAVPCSPEVLVYLMHVDNVSTVGCLSFGPIEVVLCFCDLSVREKDWHSRARGAKVT